LALAIDNHSNIGQEGRQMVLGPFAPTQRKGIDALDTTVQFAHTFADGHAAPAQFAGGALLSARTKFFDCTSHKQPPGAAFERLGSRDEQSLDRVSQFHCSTSSNKVLEV
jgi:hypothetical protein